jgi:hypothetical protein
VGEYNTVTKTTIESRTSLLKVAYAAFAELANMCPSGVREDLFAVAFYFYSREQMVSFRSYG